MTDGDFDPMKNSTDIARTNTWLPHHHRIRSSRRSSIYDLDSLDRQLDEILNYIGIGRPVPAPASGDFADRYYDKLERDQSYRDHGKEPPVSVLAPTKSKRKQAKLSSTQLRINLQEKIQDIYDYLGVRKHEFRPTSTCGPPSDVAYRYKKSMNRWVFEPR